MLLGFDSFYQNILAAYQGYRLPTPASGPIAEPQPCAPLTLPARMPITWLDGDGFVESPPVANSQQALPTRTAKKNKGGRPSNNWAEVFAAFNQFIEIHGNDHGSLRRYCRYAGISERSFRHARRFHEGSELWD